MFNFSIHMFNIILLAQYPILYYLLQFFITHIYHSITKLLFPNKSWVCSFLFVFSPPTMRLISGLLAGLLNSGLQLSTTHFLHKIPDSSFYSWHSCSKSYSGIWLSVKNNVYIPLENHRGAFPCSSTEFLHLSTTDIWTWWSLFVEGCPVHCRPLSINVQ